MTDTTLGIVIGSGMTLAGVILQGLISLFLGWRKDLRDEARHKRARREAAYRDFINFYGTILAAYGAAVASPDLAAKIPATNFYLQPNLLEKVSAVLTGVQLYGSSNIAAMASSFVQDFAKTSLTYEPMTKNRITTFDRSLADILAEVRKEMA